MGKVIQEHETSTRNTYLNKGQLGVNVSMEVFRVGLCVCV